MFLAFAMGMAFEQRLTQEEYAWAVLFLAVGVLNAGVAWINAGSYVRREGAPTKSDTDALRSRDAQSD
jgi:hypothetical protein